MFIVNLVGKGVCNDNINIGYIADTTDSSLDKVKNRIKEVFKIEVFDFTIIHGTIVALTSKDDIKVCIEPSYLIE